MSTFIRHHSSFLGIIGTGVFVGIGGTILYFKITGKILIEIHRLQATVASLQNEVQELKEKLAARRQRRRSPGFYSVHASSGDDDDDNYEEAYGGLSGWVMGIFFLKK